MRLTIIEADGNEWAVDAVGVKIDTWTEDDLRCVLGGPHDLEIREAAAQTGRETRDA